jgi:hypothetical protein
MIPLDSGPPPRPAAVVVVTVPTVATTHLDGLPTVLNPGRLRVVLPVWEASNGTERAAWLTVGATSCTPVALHPGSVVRATCDVTLRRHADATVRVLTDQGQVAAWKHVTR